MTTPPAQDADRLPRDVEWALEGRLVEASNVVVRLVAPGGERAVFKPVRGERPLSDFPPASLAHREVATYLVADAAGLRCVPETTWHVDEILGEGSLQRWVGPLVPEEQTRVMLFADDELSDAVHPIAAFDTDDGPLVLAHADDDALRDVALLDVLTNNADRKGSHLIEVAETPAAPTAAAPVSEGAPAPTSEHRLYAIDHGLTFHVDDKLRTVLWGFAGEPLSDAHVKALDALTGHDELRERLREHLTDDEVTAFFDRVATLREAGAFPEPPLDRYPLPWPPV